MSSDIQLAERRGLLPRFTLKDGNTFLLADALGDIQDSDDGLFTNDTRVLSRYELQIGGHAPSLLGADINQDNTLFTAHLTNEPLPALSEHSIPRGVIHIERVRCISDGCVYERLRLTNFSDVGASLPLNVVFNADFADIFEVKGHVRPQHGEHLPPHIGERSVDLVYRGRDSVVRATRIEFSERPQSLSSQQARFVIELTGGATAELYICIGQNRCGRMSPDVFETVTRGLHEKMSARVCQGASISTSGRLFNQWIDKSRSDLALLTTTLETGAYPYAGIPWFATQFGRDAIITGLQTLWINPDLSAGVLSFLASTQATVSDPFRDSEPGKIMHEARRGEMAALGEVPFGRYYGGVDTTPLFVMLAGAFENSTGSESLVDRIWNNIRAAMTWIERRMDASPTGLLYYERAEETGLANQGWKDSQDSIFYADGRFPHGSIAVVEVQGYAFAALQCAAQLAMTRGQYALAEGWNSRAQTLRETIETQFWIPEMNFYAIAVDASGAQCKVQASNAGHLLYCGVPSAERAACIIERLLSPGSASGWGIRTLADGQPRYNPMSYHNGSIWPHDTALCAAGMSRYGHRAAVVRILSEMFEAANHFSMRLPELYCGFPRVSGQGPVPYPVACLPQAWASGCIFMLLQALLGVQIEGRLAEVHIERPLLPIGIESLEIGDLAVGDARISLEFQRIANEVVVVPRKHMAAKVKVFAHL
jgi:glycogen debranching enzyme